MNDKIYTSRREKIEIECPECGKTIETEADIEMTIYEPDIDVEVSV